MIIQHSTGFTVSDSDSIEDAKQSDIVFRVNTSVKKNTSKTGETAYLSFNANDTKTIDLPWGYSTNDRCRFIAQVTGTVRFTIDHPTLGDQIIIAKGGSVLFSMRIQALTCTEMAGASATVKWSIYQIDNANSEDFE